MIKSKPMILFSLSALLAVFSPVSVMAETLQDYDEQIQATLQDNVLEYGELADLVAVYNPMVQSAQQNMDNSLFVYRDAEEDFRRRAADCKDKAKEMKDEGNIDEYMAYLISEKTFLSVAKGYKEAIRNSGSVSAGRQMTQLKDTMTSAVQTLMISYETVKAQREVAAKAKELAEAACRSVQTQANLGLAAEADVLSAGKNLDAAAAALTVADGTLTQIKQNLCMLTGWSYDSNPEIRPIPEPDVNQIESIDLEADKIVAIGNHYTLVSKRSGGREKTNKAGNIRKRNIEEGEQKLSIQIEQLYQTILQKRTEKDAADAAYQAAMTAKNGADQKLQMGMLSSLQYLQAEKEFLNKKAAKVSADMNFLQALSAYSWGVKGLADIGE